MLREADAYWADEIHVRDGKTYATINDDRPDEPLGRPHIDNGTESKSRTTSSNGIDRIPPATASFS